MIEKNEIKIEVLENSNDNLDENMNICPISLEPTLQLIDPVMSPYTGHIYERSFLIQAIKSNGRDPIANQPLNPGMIQPGTHIKNLIIEANTKIAAEQEKNKIEKETSNKILNLHKEENLQLKKSLADNEISFKEFMKIFFEKEENREKQNRVVREEIASLKEENKVGREKFATSEEENRVFREKFITLEEEVATLKEENKNYREEVASLRKENKQVKEDIESLEKKYSDSQDKINTLTSENNLMKELFINEEWYLYGSKIDNKIKKGCSTDYKQNALTTFAHSYKKSYKQKDINDALQQGKKFQSDPSLRQRYGLFPTFGQSESSKLVGEFINNVNQENKPLI